MQLLNSKFLFTRNPFSSLEFTRSHRARYLSIGSVLGLLCTGVLQASAPMAKDPPELPYDADLFNKDKSVFFVNAEFLYWLVNEGAVDYAIKMDEQAWSSTEVGFALGNYHNAHFDWSPGFRINFGHFNAPHYWDVLIQYTYVPSSGSRDVHAPKGSGKYLNGTWAQPAGSAALMRASCHVDMKYNVLDLLFTRRFHTNEHLRFNVFGGLTSALIFQKMKVFYEDKLGMTSHIDNRWRFQGVGMRLGLKIDWFMGYDIYLTGQVSTALLSGWYKNTAYQVTSINDNSSPIRDSDFHDNRLTYTAQFLVGPSWQKKFKSVRTEVCAGYEFTIWTNLQEIYRSGASLPTGAKETFINNSNVSLQGLTVRLNVDF